MSEYDWDELRDLLDRAYDLVDTLEESGGGTRGRFFGDPELLDALDRLGSASEPITLIVGAGASMEAGLPSWPTLIDRMLRQLAEERLSEESLHDAWIEAVGAESLTAAAAVVEALAADEDDFIERIREALYDGRPPSWYQPRALAQQVAWMKARLGADVRVVTGNYDGLLETALEQEGVTVHSYIQGRAEPPGSAAVYHVHGRLIPSYPRTGRIVLAEADYARVQQERSWQDAFMREALASSLCIFVGASLTDPNLIRWLYRYATPDHGGDPRHLAIFTRQASPRLPGEIRPLVEEATRARWAAVGVEAVFADFFAEVAQFLHEVTLARSAASQPPFQQRAQDRLDNARAYFVSADADAFADAQHLTRTFLQGVLGDLEGIAAAGSIDLSAERLGLALWGVDHAAGTAAVGATSDREFAEPESIIENGLELASRWVAVEAVTRGVVVERDPNVYASRWRLIRGVPIVLADADGAGRTISGAMTLTSMTPRRESRVSTSPGLSTAIDDFLARVGAVMLG